MDIIHTSVHTLGEVVLYMIYNLSGTLVDLSTYKSLLL